MSESIVIFHHGIVGSGGSERTTLEEEKYFNGIGIDTTILSYNYDKSVFNSIYNPKIILINPRKHNNIWIIKIIQRILCLRKAIIKLKPTYMLVVGEEGCIYMYLARLLTHYKYSIHVPQTIFWDFQTSGNKWDKSPFLLGRYSSIFKSVYKEIRNSIAGHRESLPENIPQMGFKRKLLSEVLGFLVYISVRNSEYIFVLSKIMAFEVNKMYKRNAIVLKGAYPESISRYTPIINIKKKINAEDKKVILSLCRLEPKKRVDLTIKAFSLLFEKRKDIVLVIGGSGSAEEELKSLTKSLGLENKIFFQGFIHENILFDFYLCCDVFVSADHSDYDITTYMALGFGKKVVWTIENEVDEDLLNEQIIFQAELSPESFANAIDLALDSQNGNSFPFDKYTFEKYIQTILRYLRTGVDPIAPKV